MILNWLRFKKLMVPKTMELKDVLVVAEYFGIQEMMEKAGVDILQIGSFFSRT